MAKDTGGPVLICVEEEIFDALKHSIGDLQQQNAQLRTEVDGLWRFLCGIVEGRTRPSEN